MTVGHNGMAPTLFAGDEVLVWRNAVIEHGDVAVCHHPEDRSRYVMGRALAMPGTSIGIERGGLMINGEGLGRDIRETAMFCVGTAVGAEQDRTAGALRHANRTSAGDPTTTT